MATSKSTTEEKNINTTETEGGVSVAVPEQEGAKKTDKRGRREPRSQGRRRRSGKREERARSEFDHKIVSIRRVARVVSGGRRFNFSVALVAGNRRGMVGVGTGKAGDTALAIEKAMRSARANMIRVPLTEETRIPHEVSAKYAASQIIIIPVPGRGLVAGSSVRTVLELAGVKDVMAKILSRSKNQLNNARAAVSALKQLSA